VSGVGIAARPRAASRQPAYDVALIGDRDRRAALAAVIERAGLSFAALASVNALLKRPPKHAPSLIVLWVDGAASGSTGQVESLARSMPQSPLIVVCSAAERRGVRAALAAGAAGVVLWQDVDATLGPCIQAVLAGQTCVPREHWRQIDPPALSAREKQILGLVVMGYMNGQIAEQLFLAESTVKSHLSSAFAKLGVRSRNEAVNLILDPERGLGMGILALVGDGEPQEPLPKAVP
jgi:DNA-binding NarL/FixJ family response regulator